MYLNSISLLMSRRRNELKCNHCSKFRPDGQVPEHCDPKWDNMRKKKLHQSAERIPQCSAVGNR